MEHVDTQAGLDLLAALEPATRQTAQHLLRCERCRAQLVESIEAAEAALAPVAPGARVVDFEPMWRRLAERAESAAASHREEQRQTETLLREELESLAPDARLLRLEGEARFWTLALAQTLRKEAEQAQDPASALALAKQARAVAIRLSAARYGRPVVAELLAQCWCSEAEAHRRLGDGDGAERALARAEDCLEDEPLDAPARATYCHRLALLAADRGQVDTALALLGRAADLWEELREFGALGETLTARGWLCLTHEEPEMALTAFQAAISLLEPTRSSLAALRARYGLALAYAELGRQPEAERALGRALALLDQLEARTQAPGFRWLQALVLERAGRGEEAVEVLCGLLEDLLGAGAHFDALLVGLDLARCQALHGEADARGLALLKAGDLAERAGLPPQARAAVTFVASFALRPLEDRKILLPELVSFLLRARYRPDLRFSSGKPPQAEFAWEDLELHVQSSLCRAAGLPTSLARPAVVIDPYSRELLRLTAEETARIGLTFEPEGDG